MYINIRKSTSTPKKFFSCSKHAENGDTFCLTRLSPKFLMKQKKSLSRSSSLLESFPHLC